MTRPVPGRIIVLALLVFMALGLASNLWISLGDVLRPFCRATGYLVAPTLLNYVPFFLVLGLLFRVAGKLRWRELGFETSKLPAALLWCGGAWVVAQVLLFVLAGGDLELDPRWQTQPTVSLGALFGQLLGNALCEEVFWRAFLIPQLVFLILRRERCSLRMATVAAVLLSSALFALSHIPHDLAQEHGLGQILAGQAFRFLLGIVFAVLFLLSNNLFTVVGLHSLINTPVPLFAVGSQPLLQAFFTFGPLLLLIVLRLRRRQVGA